MVTGTSDSAVSPAPTSPSEMSSMDLSAAASSIGPTSGQLLRSNPTPERGKMRCVCSYFSCQTPVVVRTN